MIESAHSSVLDREAPREFIRTHYAAQLDVLEEIVNYGTNLLVRCMRTGEKRFETHIVLSLLNHGVRMLDGFHVLIAAGSVDAAKLQQRALFEAYLNLAWILREDWEQRSRDYLVWYLRRQRTRLQRVKEGTTANSDLKSDIVAGSIPFDEVHFAEVAGQTTAHLQRIERLLVSAPLRATNDRFDALPERERHAPWYRLSGVRSLRTLAHRLHERAMYDMFYTDLSDAAHALNISDHVLVGPGGAEFEPVRNLKDLRRDFALTSHMALPIYRIELGHFRPEELANFARKFAGEWRTRLNSAPDIEIKTQYTDL